MDGPTAAEIERVFREHYGRAVAVLVRRFGDIGVAEEAVADAFTVALARWPGEGVPPSPPGWIITTARHRAIDRRRGESGARRPAAADLHLLPSGARHAVPGGAHAAPPRRPHHP